MTVAFLQLKGSCVERVEWKMPVMYLPELKSAKLSTVRDLSGEAGEDSSSTLSGGWQVWRDTEFAAYLGPWSLLRPTAKRGECFWEASVTLLSSRKRLHCRGSKTSSSQHKTTS